MSFISINDYHSRISADVLNLLIDDDLTLLNEAEADAAQLITDRLAPKYQVAAELAKTDANRNRSLVRWMVCLALYFVYGRASSDEMPERVVKDYDDTLAELEKISGGKLNCSLERVTDATTGEIKSSIRVGSIDNDMYSSY